jgi:hypothetical protein
MGRLDVATAFRPALLELFVRRRRHVDHGTVVGNPKGDILSVPLLCLDVDYRSMYVFGTNFSPFLRCLKETKLNASFANSQSASFFLCRLHLYGSRQCVSYSRSVCGCALDDAGTLEGGLSLAVCASWLCYIALYAEHTFGTLLLSAIATSTVVARCERVHHLAQSMAYVVRRTSN